MKINTLSLVIPLYNEEKTLRPLHKRITSVLRSLPHKYEVIYINDSSNDTSQRILETLQKQDPHVKILEFRRNFGQTAAMAAGFDYASGDVIVTLDADLQNDPTDIPRLLEKIEDGYDIVSGWRRKRHDKLLTRRIPSIVANWLISKLTSVHLHDYGCTLKAYTKDVAKNIKLYGDMHRFIPAISSLIGAKVTELEVKHHPRRHGRSKYGFSRTFKVFLDLLTIYFLVKFLAKPMRFFGSIGLLLGGIGISLGTYLTFIKLFYHVRIGNRPLLLLAVLLILVSIQLLALGILGELLSRIYFESQSRPVYTVRKESGFKPWPKKPS